VSTITMHIDVTENPCFQSVQSRLVEDNKTLAVERSHLSDLMTNVQKMHNDLERSGENDRRRLESQMQMLENQTYVEYLLDVCHQVNIKIPDKISRHS
jgi:thiaminase